MELFIDHINGDRADNRVENLRVCTRRENCSFDNVKRHKRSKIIGAQFDISKQKWIPKIRINNIIYNLGSFDTDLEAGEAYQKALNRYIEKNELPTKPTYSSIYKGVYYSNTYNKWIAEIYIGRRNKRVGTFNTELEAYKARDIYLRNN